MKGVWHTLKVIKGKMKMLHVNEFKGVHDRIDQFRRELGVVQGALMQNPMNISLMEEEKNVIQQLSFWLRIDASIMKQKSRIRRLKEGSENTGFFHANVKDRRQTNKIVSLTDEMGVV